MHTLVDCIVAAGTGGQELVEEQAVELVEVQVVELALEPVVVQVGKEQQAEVAPLEFPNERRWAAGRVEVPAEVVVVQVIAVLHMKNQVESEEGAEEVVQEEAVVPDNCSLIEIETEDWVGIEAVVVECTAVGVLAVGIAVAVLAERFEVVALAARKDIQSQVEARGALAAVVLEQKGS